MVSADSFRRSMRGSSVRGASGTPPLHRGGTTVAFESVRSYVQLASGLGEMTKAKAMDAAQGLLALPGADEVTRRAVQASTLADQLLEAARANRANLLSLIEGEVEAALKRADVARVADVDAARATLTAVTKEIAELRAMLVATGASAVAGASRSSRGRSVGASGAVTTARRVPAPAAESSPAKKASATRKSAPAKKATATKATAATKSAPAKKATAKKTTASTAPAKKATAKKATAKKTVASTAPAKKATAKKTTAKKAST
jgi:polyhydroxyalkanoate synthesis regulator phasin